MKCKLLLPIVASCAGILVCPGLRAQGGSAIIIFEQPTLAGIAGNFHVPLAEHGYPTQKAFNLILWQPNPGRPDGELIPSNWRVGDMTGFYPVRALPGHQAAFRDEAGASTVQIEGETVGAYLNSHDISHGPRGDKMMITPEFRPAKSQRTCPFARPGAAIVESLDLQIPTARDLDKKGNFTYVTADLEFEDIQTLTRISYGITLFHHGGVTRNPPAAKWLKEHEVKNFDAPSHSFQVGDPLALGSDVVTLLARSALYQTEPWRGWRSFDFAITQENFWTALQALKERGPGFGASQHPADYALTEWHLNAELTYGTGPADLGWSMRRARVALVPENQLSVFH